MDTNLQKMAEDLARDFSTLIRLRLSRKQLREVITENARRAAKGDKYSCATHDFCDANEYMSEAFRSRYGHLTGADQPPLDHDADENDTDLWNRAWDIAKQANFFAGFPPIAIAKTVFGVTCFAYVIDSAYIWDPTISECGRFEVDPWDAYELSTEAVALLQHLNADIDLYPPQTVDDYFYKVFGTTRPEELQMNCPLDSPVGRECERLIDLGGLLLKSLPDVSEVRRADLEGTVRAQCLVLIHG